MSLGGIRSALWEALIQRAEALHGGEVLGKRLASEAFALSRVINLLGRRRTKP